MNLSWLLQKLFELHSKVPRALFRSGRAFSPIHMMIEVTYRCNLRCNFCQYLDIIEGRKKPLGSTRDLPLADIKRCIDELPRGRLISFAGGETLVRKDFPEILAYAARRHRVHIITNGVLITEEIAKLYVDLAPRFPWQNGLVLVEISLEGDEELHDRIVQRKGSWRRATDAMGHLVRLRNAANKRYPMYDIKLVVTRDSVGAMVDFMHLARRLGVDIVNFMAEHDLMGNAEGGVTANLHRPQRSPEGVDPEFLRRQLVACFELERSWGGQIRLTPNIPIEEFVRHYQANWTVTADEYACDGPWSRIGVTGDGRYGPMCPYAAGDDARKQTIHEVWNGDRYREFRRATRDAGIYPGCNGCCNLRYTGPLPFGLAGVPAEQRGVTVVESPPSVRAA